MSCSLNSLKGCDVGDYSGTIIGVIKGYTRSLDYSSYDCYRRLVTGVGVNKSPLIAKGTFLPF